MKKRRSGWISPSFLLYAIPVWDWFKNWRRSIVADGIVVLGDGYVSEASITGGSHPQRKTKGTTVYAGTILESGTLETEAVKLREDTTFSKIIQLVEEAQDAKRDCERTGQNSSSCGSCPRGSPPGIAGGCCALRRAESLCQCRDHSEAAFRHKWLYRPGRCLPDFWEDLPAPVFIGARASMNPCCHCRPGGALRRSDWDFPSSWPRATTDNLLHCNAPGYEERRYPFFPGNHIKPHLYCRIFQIPMHDFWCIGILCKKRFQELIENLDFSVYRQPESKHFKIYLFIS